MTGTILTAVGKAKIASATPEAQLQITHVAVGDGNGSYPALTENMVALANEVWRGSSSNPIRDVQAANTLMFESAIPPDVGGFTIREIGIFDVDGDMIAIGHVDPAQVKPLPTTTTAVNMTVRMIIALANAEQTNLVLSVAPVVTHNGLADRDVFGAHPATAISYGSGSVEIFLNNQELINAATYSTVESVADMLAIENPKNKQKVQTLSFYADLGKGGAYYIYDSSKADQNNGITIHKGWVLQWDGKNLDLLQAGCYGDGDSASPHDDGVKIGECLNILYELGGGSLQGRGFSYLNETTNYTIDTDNVFIVNAKFIRNGTLNNWMFRTARTKDINGGGFIKVEGKGNSTVAIGNGFINMGSNDFKHNKWVLQDIVADNFTQYGVGINGGDDWYAKNIKVLNHGLTAGTLTACMGFYVYPRNPGGSKGGQLDTVYSEISVAAQANSNLNAAAIKLQTHQKANFKNITAVGGSEQCFGIDSVDGSIKDIFVYPQGERPGLLLGNQNEAHEFSGQTFVLDGFAVIDAPSSTGTYAMVIGAGQTGFYKLDGCTIKNGKARRFKSLARTAFKDCHFENIDCDDVRLSTAYQALEANTVKSTGNTFNNVKAKASIFAVETDSSTIIDSGTNQAKTSAGVIIIGDNNILQDPICSSIANGLTFNDNSLGNIVKNPIINATGRRIWFKSGSNNNIVINPYVKEGTAVLNNGGTGNKVEQVKAIGLTVSSTAPDIVSALQIAGLAE